MTDRIVLFRCPVPISAQLLAQIAVSHSMARAGGTVAASPAPIAAIFLPLFRQLVTGVLLGLGPNILREYGLSMSSLYVG